MATETATIRVARRTRERLAARARARGLSLSALVAELAEKAERESTFRAERRAVRVDAGEPVVAEEEAAWEASLDDGLD